MIPGIEEYLRPGKSAILVIDIQNDFCHARGHFGRQNLNLFHIHKIAPHIDEFVKNGSGSRGDNSPRQILLGRRTFDTSYDCMKQAVGPTKGNMPKRQLGGMNSTRSFLSKKT